MMALFESNIRLGGDPRGLAEYIALRDELSKLNHPARPDVDWLRVEQLCLALHAANGVELQSMAVLALARAQLYGLPGLEEGLQMIGRQLAQEWSRLWPPALAARLELLSWLFDQLQPLLRGLVLTAADLPLAGQLNAGLAQLSELLDRRTQVPMVALQGLRQQLGSVIRRLARDTSPFELLSQASAEPGNGLRSALTARAGKVLAVVADNAPGVVVVALDDDLPRSSKRRTLPRWWLVLACVLGLGGLLGWGQWLWRSAGHDQLPSAKVPEPVRLDRLFRSGSAELRPDATKVLINGLIGIKARPDWLIVITGHSDNTGNAGQNLELSQARAAAVRDWMQLMGDIPDYCFVVQGFAASQPIASNDTEDGRAANRRVEISLLPAPGACVRPGP